MRLELQSRVNSNATEPQKQKRNSLDEIADFIHKFQLLLRMLTIYRSITTFEVSLQLALLSGYSRLFWGRIIIFRPYLNMEGKSST